MKKLMLTLAVLVCATSSFAYYNPEQGRFINRDPIAEDGGVNLYGFVRNGPIDLFDQFGLDNLSIGSFEIATQSFQNAIPPGVDSSGNVIGGGQFLPDMMLDAVAYNLYEVQSVNDDVTAFIDEMIKGVRVAKNVRRGFIRMISQYECCSPKGLCTIDQYDGVINNSNDNWTIAHRITGCELKAAGVSLENMALLNGLNETIEFFRPTGPEVFKHVNLDSVDSFDGLRASVSEGWDDYLHDTINDILAVREGFDTDGSNCFERFIPEECHKEAAR